MSAKVREQPSAPARPVIVAVLCTPPSRVPSGLNLNRTSRIGPSATYPPEKMTELGN